MLHVPAKYRTRNLYGYGNFPPDMSKCGISAFKMAARRPSWIGPTSKSIGFFLCASPMYIYKLSWRLMQQFFSYRDHKNPGQTDGRTEGQKDTFVGSSRECGVGDLLQQFILSWSQEMRTDGLTDGQKPSWWKSVRTWPWVGKVSVARVVAM